MIDKRTLLPRLAVLGGLAFSLPMWGQYSSPIRDVNDPGRTPFQFFSQDVTGPGLNTPVVVTSLPVSSSQRLVMDFANIRVQSASTVPSFVLIQVSASSSLPGFRITLPVIPLALPGDVQQISIGSQAIRLYVGAGQTLLLESEIVETVQWVGRPDSTQLVAP